MPSQIWKKNKIIKEINSNLNTKTYLVRIEPIVKEIIPKNINEYIIRREKLEKLKNNYKINEIIEENNKIYIVIDNNNDIISEIDKLLVSNENNIKKEGIIRNQGKIISKKEIKDLLKMENSMCKINYEKFEENEIKKGKGTGFFCEINNFPIKYALFTNNHVLNEFNIKLANRINIEYYKDSIYEDKTIEIDNKRRIFTNKDLDYTCIEIKELDNIKNFFKLDPIIFSNNKNYYKNSDIFILQYPKGNELSFSYGEILSIRGNNIHHDCSTEEGSSGSPIIRRCKDNYIIGLHYGTTKKSNNNDDRFNLGTTFDSILIDIYRQIKLLYIPKINKIENKLNEIKCLYYPKDDEKEIQLLHDYKEDIIFWNEERKKLYLEAKKINKQLYEKYNIIH